MYVLVLSLLSFQKCHFVPVKSYWHSYLVFFIFSCENTVWWLQMFCVYPPLEMVHWFFAPPLVVIDPLHSVMVMSVPTLEMQQFCSGGFETGLYVVLGLPTFLHQFLKMVPQYWDAVMLLLSL